MKEETSKVKYVRLSKDLVPLSTDPISQCWGDGSDKYAPLFSTVSSKLYHTFYLRDYDVLVFMFVFLKSVVADDLVFSSTKSFLKWSVAFSRSR